MAAGQRTIAEIPLVWIATGGCSGCSISLLNSASPTIQELLLEEVLPGQHLSLAFHTTIMAASGKQATQALNEVVDQHDGKFVLVVDGATAIKDDGLYCCTGEEDGRPVTGYEQLVNLGSRAMAVLAVGACAGFGGIPAAGVNPTGCVSVGQLFERENIETPYVNIPGCPPHPDWIVGTIATLLLGGLEALEMDENHRPAPFFQQCIHDNCPYRGHFERGQFAEHFGEHGCLIKLGCKGPITYADCPIRKFNNGTNWCCEAGHPCIGCCHPDFPFEQSLFAPVEPADLDYPALYASAEQEMRPNTDTYVAVGLLGAGGFLAGLGVAAAAKKLKAQEPVASSVSEQDSSEEV
jgi:hydrogenase small subunit